MRHAYARALADEKLGHVATDVVRMDLEDRPSAIAACWQRMLRGTGAYEGRPLARHRAVHTQVPSTEEHFARWRSRLDGQFDGPATTELACSAPPELLRTSCATSTPQSRRAG